MDNWMREMLLITKKMRLSSAEMRETSNHSIRELRKLTKRSCLDEPFIQFQCKILIDNGKEKRQSEERMEKLRELSLRLKQIKY
jgi:hypothetical protein